MALLLTSKSHAKDFPQKPAHVAFIDADNDGVRALDRMPKPEADSADQHSLVFSSGSAGGLKGLAISRKLLTFSRQDGDNMQLFDAGVAVAELEPMLRQLLGRYVQLDVQTAKEPLPLRFDRGQFERQFARPLQDRLAQRVLRAALGRGGEGEEQVGREGVRSP